jgi:Spy/CpxP family protein refolding chaperone
MPQRFIVSTKGGTAPLWGPVIGSDGRCHFLTGIGQAAVEATELEIGRRMAMRTVLFAFAFLTVMLASASLSAQEVKAKLVERFEELNLTDEQEAKIQKIQQENRPKIEAAAKELSAIGKEEMDKVMAVLTPEQKEKLAAMKDERKERRAEGLSERVARIEELDLSDSEEAQLEALRKESRPRMEKAMASLQGALNEEQKKVREQGLQSGKKHRDIFTSLRLTDDQKEKVLEASKECRAALKEEMSKIAEILTAEQKEKLAELKDERADKVRDRRVHRIANLKELNLTGEQIAKIVEIRKEYRPKVQEAGNKLRAAIREEVSAIGEVL